MATTRQPRGRVGPFPTNRFRIAAQNRIIQAIRGLNEVTGGSNLLVSAPRRPQGPRKVTNAEHIATAKPVRADGHTGRDTAKFLGVSRGTLYRYLNEGMRGLRQALNAGHRGGVDPECRFTSFAVRYVAEVFSRKQRG